MQVEAKGECGDLLYDVYYHVHVLNGIFRRTELIKNTALSSYYINLEQ